MHRSITFVDIFAISVLVDPSSSMEVRLVAFVSLSAVIFKEVLIDMKMRLFDLIVSF